MQRQIATIDPNGQLSIPSEMQAALGLHPGSKVQIYVQDRHLVLQPLDLHHIVRKLRGLFSSTRGLTEDLLEDRRAEELQSQSRQERW